MVENGTTGEFTILFQQLLNYRTPVAAQGHIPLYKDMAGIVVNDGHDYDTPTQSMHIAVLPMSDSTLVVAFCLKENKKYQRLIHQMKYASEEKNQRFIFHSIIAHNENCFFSKDVLGIISTNMQLRQLAMEIDGLPYFGNMVRTKRELDCFRENYQSPGYYDIPNLLAQEYAV